MSRPVSTALEQEVLGQLRQQGIVVWLDKDAIYTPFVDTLIAKHAAGAFAFPVVAFRGSFLELVFALSPYGNGTARQPLLVHLPGFNQETVYQTPALELYEAGTRFHKGLDTLIREAAAARVAPADVERFIGQQPSLESADAWLATAMAQSTFGLAAALEQFGPALLAAALADSATLAPRVQGDDLATLRDYTLHLTGMDAAWEAFFPTDRLAKPLDALLHRLAGWVLCVEYVHDLKRAPYRPELQRLTALTPPLVKASCALVGQLRRDNGDAYVRLADEIETFLGDELKAMQPDDLGQIDTFREEENRVLTGAVAALHGGQWAKAKSWCEARRGDKSFWLQRDQQRRFAWNLVEEASEFGATLARHPTPFDGARSLDEATVRYASGASDVDRAHRRFEQRRLALLDSRLPHYGELREVATELRSAHRAWADGMCREFATLCKENGFLPSSSMQQRTLFEQVVHPLTQTGDKVAFFVIDAFRFEMATELVGDLQGPGTVVDLKPRLAELPSITSVGMNVLAPVAKNERLTVAGEFGGFKTGEFTVRTPEDRARAMGLRSGGKAALSLKLAEVCEANTFDLTKKIKSHQLIVVHSKEIDDAGEANVGIPTFESTLRQIKAAWHHLQLAGVKNFVFTADHGFLLQDETTAKRDFGSKRTPQRRHVFDAHARGEKNMVNVAVSSLGYDGIEGYLLFCDDTAVFTTGNAGATFVHGGNSPQERVIPVLTVTRQRAEKGGLSEYAIEVQAERPAMGLQRIKLRLRFAKLTTTTLGFVAPRSVDLALRVPERDDVRVIFKDVTLPSALKLGRLQVPIDDAWTEVFFTLEGLKDERVRIEIYHPDSVEKVNKASPEEWYSVSGTVGGSKSASSPSAASEAGDWTDAIEDPGIKKIFRHIETHGAITETEVTTLLGSPRAFRRFSLEFETHLPKLPFRVRIEAGEGGKRYVREGDR